MKELLNKVVDKLDSDHIVVTVLIMGTIACGMILSTAVVLNVLLN